MRNQRRSKGRLLPVYIFLLAMVIAALIYIFITRETTKAINVRYETLLATTPQPTLAPPTLAAQTTPALLRSGSISADVKTLQQRLADLGFYQGEIDGHFGGATKDAVYLFQLQHSLDADGMAGEKTLALLYSDSAGKLSITPPPKPTPTSEATPTTNQ